MTTAFQWVFDNAQTIRIDRLKNVSSTTSRSGVVRAVTRPGQPWLFEVQLPAGPRWTDSRKYISEIEALDRTTVGTVQFSNSGHDWLIGYQGDLADPSAITYTTPSGISNTITLTGGHTGLTSGQYIFKAGDVIQLDTTGHCYTVAADVAHDASTVTLHRPIIDPSSSSGTLLVAENCTWSVICVDFPQWEIFSRDQVGWSGSFVFVEDLS